MQKDHIKTLLLLSLPLEALRRAWERAKTGKYIFPAVFKFPSNLSGKFLLFKSPQRYLCTNGKHIKETALAGVAQWIERRPANQMVTGWIPSHMPGLRARSPVGGAQEATTH